MVGEDGARLAAPAVFAGILRAAASEQGAERQPCNRAHASLWEEKMGLTNMGLGSDSHKYLDHDSVWALSALRDLIKIKMFTLFFAILK